MGCGEREDGEAEEQGGGGCHCRFTPAECKLCLLCKVTLCVCLCSADLAACIIECYLSHPPRCCRHCLLVLVLAAAMLMVCESRKHSQEGFCGRVCT